MENAARNEDEPSAIDSTAKTAGREPVRHGYRIGTVAGLTGLDPHTIRAWERRHGAVKPSRSERGTRLYDDHAIERLQLIKALVDCGEPIRRVAPLSDEVLREQLQRMAGISLHGETPSASCVPDLSLGILSSAIDHQLAAHARGMPGLRAAVFSDRREAFVEQVRQAACDVLVLELEQLGSEPLKALDECLVASQARFVVVLYHFARRGELTRLARRGAKLLRSPLALEALHRAVLDLVAADRATERRQAPESPPREIASREAEPPRFDAVRLARIAEISTAIDCECPQHLSGLVRSLVAFEEYSKRCASRNEADAAIHRELARGTARARSAMEDLLEALCDHEGIDA